MIRRFIIFASFLFLIVVILTSVLLFALKPSSKPPAPLLFTSSLSPTFTPVPVTVGPISIDVSQVRREQGQIYSGAQAFRTDPLQVAREDGKQYGFSTGDKFVLLQQFYDETLNTFVAQVKVFHQGTNYLILLKQPGVKGVGGAWKIFEIKKD